MKGVQIFMHSLRQVTDNLEGALRVSLVPYVIQVAAGLLFVGRAETLADLGDPAGGPGFGFVLAGVVVVVTSLWIAVAWHRYVLLNEKPAGLLPAFHGPLLWDYFLRSLGYAVIVVVGALVLGTVVSLLLGGLIGSSVVLLVVVTSLLVYLPLTVAMLRLASVLPGAALGTRHDFLAGVQATAGKTEEIAVLAVIAVGARVILVLIGVKLFASLPIIGFAWDAVIGWFVTMVGASILTTLYGHYVEGRPLRA